MYECPGCGGNLKFDISRQQLLCEYCGSQADPYSFQKEQDAGESGGADGAYEVRIFTCPQCGGEIISEDTTAATFCSFCGGATILDSRISRERRPEIIIPFTRTKEDCRASYGRLLRRAVFAPKELKDETLIAKFRGIYMPYWVYSFEKREQITFSGSRTHREGDYKVTDHYRLKCRVEEEYRGLAYDASSAFSDSLSSAIAPFDLKKGKPFTPSFLSGFYADTSDVEKYVYFPEAEELVVRDAWKRLSRDAVCRKYHAGQAENRHEFRNALRPSDSTAELAMLPVWFLAYRNGDRVSYAVVNGQTGKAAADLPVDGKRYLAASLLLAVPLFFLLNLFLTVTPGKLLLTAVLLAVLCILILNGQLSRILDRESGEDDRGLASVRPVHGNGRERDGWMGRKPGRRIRSPWKGSLGKVAIMLLLFYGTAFLPAVVLVGLEWIGFRGKRQAVIMILGILMFAGVSLAFSALGRSGGRGQLRRKPLGGGRLKEKWPVLIKPFGGIVLSAVILLVNPVSDLFYYIGAFVCMGTVLWAILDIFRQHNMLTTRKLPQLNRRGGDESEAEG